MKRKQLLALKLRFPLELEVQQSSTLLALEIRINGFFKLNLYIFFLCMRFMHIPMIDFCIIFPTSHSEQVFCCLGSSAALVLDGHDLKLLSVKVEGKLLKVSI